MGCPPHPHLYLLGPRSGGPELAGTARTQSTGSWGRQGHPLVRGWGVHLNMAMSRFMSSTLVTSRKVTSSRMTSQLA